MEDDIDEIIDKEEAKFPVYIKEKVKNLIYKYEKTRERILYNGELLDKKEYKKISSDLEKYIRLKLLKKNLQKLENKKNKIKMIIIWITLKYNILLNKIINNFWYFFI